VPGLMAVAVATLVAACGTPPDPPTAPDPSPAVDPSPGAGSSGPFDPSSVPTPPPASSVAPTSSPTVDLGTRPEPAITDPARP